MFTEDWTKHIKIDRDELLGQLTSHFFTVDKKLVLRFYTLKASGTRILVNGICEALHNALPYYVFGDKEIEEKGAMWAGLNAKSKYGEKQPQTDGKYGELLLFALVESVLGCKMVAHKIKSLSNTSDQIKGGDGIFIGNYDIEGSAHPAYLIGESKVTAKFYDALTQSLISIDRFHNLKDNSGFLDDELIVAKEFIRISAENLNELYARLTPTSDEFKKQVLVHPVLMMYNTNWFGKFEAKASTPHDLEALIANQLIKADKILLEKIRKKLEGYPQVKKVYLDFFILPCSSIDDFRNSMYQKIHGVPPKS